MKFYYCRRNEPNQELTMEEVRKHLSEAQIQEAIEAKQDDPNEEVSYMAKGGIILVTF